jgi:ribosome maturation factor RimP
MVDAREQQVADLAAPIAGAHAADVEDVTIRKAGRRSVVVVALDADGGISLDTIAALTPDLSAALDEAEVMGETPYTLEVTSPGVHRPLTLPRHWRRANGRLVRVQRTDGTTVTGRLVASDEHTATLHVDGADEQLPYTAVAKAVVQVEFGEGGA